MKYYLAISLLAVLAANITPISVLADVDVSLNLRYHDPADVTEGGTWTLVSKTDTVDSNGVSNLVARYTDIDAAGTVDPNVGHNILGGLLGVTAIGSDVEFEYGQDPNQPLTLHVGQVGGPSDLGLDPLGEPAWDHASVIATGTFSSSRPGVVSASASEFDGANSNAVVGATIGSHLVRGDSATFQGQGDRLVAGDTDRDFDVDTGDITRTLAHFTGAGFPLANAGWEKGDFDDDQDIDGLDHSLVGSNFTGDVGLPNMLILDPPTPLHTPPTNPDLIYNPTTGNVAIDRDGVNLLSFNLQSAGQFTGPASFADLDASIFGSPFSIPGLTDNSNHAIGWVSAFAIINVNGSVGPEPADIGNILPTGLDLAGLEDLLLSYNWAGLAIASGPGWHTLSGGQFDLVIVPEPATGLLLGMGCLFVGLLRPPPRNRFCPGGFKR